MYEKEKYFIGSEWRSMKEAVIAICDEASADMKTLREYIEHFMPKAKFKICHTGRELTRTLQKDRDAFDLIFLEPGMEEECGIHTAERIRKINRKVPMIFISNTDKFYREAFDLYAFQYLRKPVAEAAVADTINMWRELNCSVKSKLLHFKYRSQVYTYHHQEVEYISSSLHTVNFHLTNGKLVHCRGKLSDFDEQLEGSSFVRCHQSFYINIEAVMGMKSDCFVMRDCVVPISRSYMKEAQNAYKEYLAKIKR